MHGLCSSNYTFFLSFFVVVETKERKLSVNNDKLKEYVKFQGDSIVLEILFVISCVCGSIRPHDVVRRLVSPL